MEQRIAYLGGNHAPDDGTARTAWHIGKADDSALILPTSTWRKTLRYVALRPYLCNKVFAIDNHSCFFNSDFIAVTL